MSSKLKTVIGLFIFPAQNTPRPKIVTTETTSNPISKGKNNLQHQSLNKFIVYLH